MVFALRVLAQDVDFQTPFDLTVPGFMEEWWERQIGRARDRESEFLSFVQDGDEVARAEVDRGMIDNFYVGLTPAPQVVDIVFFEVRDSCRRAGKGRAAVSLIVQRYKREMLIAFSEDADRFWSGIGWKHHPREDRSPHHRPLFVLDDRVPVQRQIPIRVR